MIITTYSELYEAQRWHTDHKLWTPMIVLTNGQHIFIGDIIGFDNYLGESTIGKVVRFVHMVGLTH